MSKTIFILVGGNDRHVADYGQRLKDEIRKYVSHPKILSCFFAWPESTWPAKFEEWKAWFAAALDGDFSYDYAKKSTFLQQVDEADVVYLHGGNTQLLFDTLPDAGELTRHLDGKIVVGSSAGANVLSKNYWSSSKATPHHGLGILNLNVMVHHGVQDHEGRARTAEDWRREENEFRKFAGAGEITYLPEGQFVTRIIDDI